MIHDLTLSIRRKQLLCLLVGYTSALRSHQHLISGTGRDLSIDTVDGSRWTYYAACYGRLIWSFQGTLKLQSDSEVSPIRHHENVKRLLSPLHAAFNVQVVYNMRTNKMQNPLVDFTVIVIHHCSIVSRSAMICGSLPSQLSLMKYWTLPVFSRCHTLFVDPSQLRTEMTWLKKVGGLAGRIVEAHSCQCEQSL